jgi:hypothetical protein
MCKKANAQENYLHTTSGASIAEQIISLDMLVIEQMVSKKNNILNFQCRQEFYLSLSQYK